MNCRRAHDNNGIILIDKPQGLTSHDIVDFIRKKFKFAKVGHAGTLDPMATGLLIILLGRFTKKSLYFSNYDKEYKAALLLGISTDTADREGNVLARKDPGAYEERIKNINEIFRFFQGQISQIPPMYSAKKINGKKLYEFARKGVVLKREPKTVFISEIRVLDVSLPQISFCVTCSKGTYIRQLAHDIGEKIGCGAHLIFLRRTKIGPFSVRCAVPFEKLVEGHCAGTQKPLSRPKDIFHENILQPE